MISIIIPTRNEAVNIAKVIEELKKYSPPDSEIIVVDNNSQDNTPEIAETCGARVIRRKIPGRGKGSSLILGAKEAKGNILVFIDGDNTYQPKSILNLIKPVLKEDKDIVYGSRFLKDSICQNMTFLRYFGNRIFTLIASLLYQKTTDLLTGFYAIKKERFFELGLENEGFEIEVEIFTKACQKKIKRKEVPIEYISRNRESKLNPLKDGLKFLKILFKNKLC